MNLRQVRENDKLREKLASEYVLGTLRGGARRRFEAWLREDAVLRRSVAEWQDRLHPMAEFTPAAHPSPQVWNAIERQLNLRSSRGAYWLSLREDIGFWRGLGLVSTTVALILVSVLLTRLPEPGAPMTSYVATLTNEQSQPVVVITGDAKRRQLTVKVVAKQDIAPDKSLELWAVPKQGSPRSLGLVAANGSVTLPLPENATPDAIPVLAISLEPKGGSPNKSAPSGPIVYKGAWLQI